MNRIDTFCPICDEPVTAQIVARRETLPVRGVPTTFDAQVAVCPLCGEDIGDSRVEKGNFEVAFAAYRAEHGIVTSEEIKAIRKTLGLSLREFSLFLGFGEQTVTKYEAGTLPDELHSNAMRMASTKEGAEMLLSLNGDRISKASRAKVRKCLGLEDDRPARLAFHPIAASIPLLL